MILIESSCPEGSFYGVSQILWSIVAYAFKVLARSCLVPFSLNLNEDLTRMLWESEHGS